MFVWNNVQTIGTIIWKHYPDTDDKRPGGTTNLDLSGRSGRSCKFWSDHAYGNALKRLTRTGRSKAIPESEVEAESWIIKVTKHIRIIKLYSFKNLGIMNLCTSARESRIIVTRLWEKLNKIHVWINCVLSRWCMIWRFRDSPQVSNFFSGAACPQISLYNSCIRDWQSACSVSYNLVFDVQLQKK